MSSKRRVRRKQCQKKKKRFASQTDAVACLIYVKKKFNEVHLHSYKCNVCGFWHLGHKKFF